jgi:hypothetical protein
VVSPTRSTFSAPARSSDRHRPVRDTVTRSGVTAVTEHVRYNIGISYLTRQVRHQAGDLTGLAHSSPTTLTVRTICPQTIQPVGRKDGIMAVGTCVKKTVVVATLRSRDLHGRADWVEKEFPALIDTVRNASLLHTLGINVDTLAPDAWPDRVAVASN